MSITVLLAASSASESGNAAAADYAAPAQYAPEPPGLAEDLLGTIPAEPPEFVMRPRLPLCGAERPDNTRETGLGVQRNPAARRCLLRAWRQDSPAELISVSPSIEGPFLVIYRVIGDGTVEALSDDPYGHGPVRKICRRLRVSLNPTPASSKLIKRTGIRAGRCKQADTWD